jgi:multiple sugar transport system substrate-binding protein/putative aldouronate transport system substrate-binding protein
MKERFKKLLSFMLVLVLTLSLFTACGDNEDTNEGSSETSSNTQGNDSDEENQSPYDEFITVDVFSSQANYQGIQSGWFGEIVKEKFNMELNIIGCGKSWRYRDDRC